MSWHEGKHSKEVPVKLVNSKWENIRGDISPDEAQDWLVRYLAANPAAACQLLIGPTKGRLKPIQDIFIRTWFKRDTNMLIAGRGFSKSYTASMFIVLYAILNPGAKIGIFSASFRQAKLIFYQIEEFLQQNDSHILQQCVNIDKISHSTDSHEMTIGKSKIKAMPLTAKTRGLRFSLIVIDEYLSVPEKLVKEIIKPMMVVNRGDPAARAKIRKGEDILIAQGKMQEWERTVFLENKILMLSSACYEFDTLYKETYMNILKSIHDETQEHVSHSLFRLGYKLAPPGQLSDAVIADALKTYSENQFNREYNAKFTKENGGFYNIRHILAATVDEGEEPVMKLKGNPDHEYILAIDPNFSAGSEDADNFAMAVLELAGNGTEIATLVHAYAMAKSDVKKRTLYLEYLLTNFNIQLIVVDNAGGPRFIEEFRALHPENPMKLEVVDIDFDSPEGFEQTRRLYNPTAGKMVISIPFNQRNFIRSANEALQADIQHKRIMFASTIMNNDFHRELNMDYDLKVNIDDLEFKSMDSNISKDEKRAVFIENLEFVIETTKKEMAMIEISTDAVGNIKFDLPKSLKNTSGKDKARRDSYTALLLGAWGRILFYRLRNAGSYNLDVCAGMWLEN